MNIGLVTGEFPPMQGGVGAFSKELAQALNDLGHDVHVITSRKARPRGVTRSLWDLYEPFDLGYAQLHPRAGRWWWGDIGRVADVARRFNVDVINLQYQAAAFNMVVPAVNLLPWRLRGLSKTVVTFHDLRVPYLFPKAGPLREHAILHLARSADGVIVTNQSDYDTLAEAGLAPERLVQIPIGSNIVARPFDVGVVEALKHKLGLGPDEMLLGYFGFLNASKGADLLIEALADLPESVHLVFIGGRTGSSDAESNRDFLQRVEKSIKELDLAKRIHWSGYISDAEVSAYLQASDVMVMPYRDGVTLRRGTLMAILAHGRPLVTTPPQGPVAELVHGHNLIFANQGDADGLTEAILQLLAQPELRARLSVAARETAEAFTWDRIASRSAKFFEEICGASPGREPRSE